MHYVSFEHSSERYFQDLNTYIDAFERSELSQGATTTTVKIKTHSLTHACLKMTVKSYLRHALEKFEEDVRFFRTFSRNGALRIF